MSSYKSHVMVFLVGAALSPMSMAQPVAALSV